VARFTEERKILLSGDDYLFAAVIIVTIVFASSTMIMTISEPIRTMSEREQLKIVSQKLMAQILLNPGDPGDWGKDISTEEGNLKTFGIAMYSETTREAYALDPDKVLRLNSGLRELNSTRRLYVSPSRVINLLNLGKDYGLALEIHPALKVEVQKTPGLDNYTVSVKAPDSELPMVGASVTARMYYYNAGGISSLNSTTQKTDYEGKARFDLVSIPTEMKVLVFVVDYNGISVLKLFRGSSVITGYLLGNHLFINKASSVSGNVKEVIIIKKAGGYAVEAITSSLTKVEEERFDLTYVEPSTVAVLVISEDGASLVLASREVEMTYSSIPGTVSFPFSYSVERTVIINGSAYIMRLHLWRMSW